MQRVIPVSRNTVNAEVLDPVDKPESRAHIRHQQQKWLVVVLLLDDMQNSKTQTMSLRNALSSKVVAGYRKRECCRSRDW